MYMRKSKPLVASPVSGYRSRSLIRSQDDGIMAVPIPAEQNADKEMKDYIQRNKQKSIARINNICFGRRAGILRALLFLYNTFISVPA
jgi:hypothetical protein